MKKVKSFFNLKNLRISFGILFIFTTHISSISFSRVWPKKEIDVKFLKIQNFEVSGINKLGKINVSDDVVSTLPDHIEFLYSIDGGEYKNVPPNKLSNGDRVNIKISINNNEEYKFSTSFVNKITVLVLGLPKSNIRPILKQLGKEDNPKFLRLKFNHFLKKKDWTIFHAHLRTTPSSMGYFQYFDHPNADIRTAVAYFGQTKTVFEYIDLIFKRKSDFWIKFKNKEHGTIYKFVNSNIETHFIDSPLLIKQPSRYDLSSTTKYSLDARPALKITNINLEKMDVYIKLDKVSSSKVFKKVNLIKLKSREKNIYVIPKEYQLGGDSKYKLKISIKKELVDIFFPYGKKDAYLDFKTKKQSREGTRKPKIISEEFKLPKTSLTMDGEYMFELQGFNEGIMKVELFNARGLMIKRGSATNKWIVQNLRSNEEFKIKISFKNRYLRRYSGRAGWRESKTPHYIILKRQMKKQSYNGVSKPEIIFTVKAATTKKSIDAELKFRIRYDSNKIKFKIFSMFNGTKREHIAHKTKQEKWFIVKKLQSEEEIFAHFMLIDGSWWHDGTNKVIKRIIGKIPITRITGTTKPIINFKNGSEKSARTKTSRDGEMIFVIEGFDKNAMKIKSSAGNILKIPSSKNLWKVTNLHSNQKVIISIELKNGYFWNTKDNLKEEILFEKNAKEIFYEGLHKVEVLEDTNTENSIIPSTFSSSDGELGLRIKSNGRFFNQKEISDFFKNIDLKMISSNSKNILKTNPLKIINLMHMQKISIILKPKNGHYWQDGKKAPIQFELKTPILNAIGINQPSIEDISIFNPPSNGISKDGIIRIYLSNFNSNKMILQSDEGTVQPYNRESHPFYISKIQSNQKIKITIKPKSGYAWNSGFNVMGLFTMDKILEFPNNAKNIKITKQDPLDIGEDGYVNAGAFIPIRYKGEKIEAAHLEYQENGIGDWDKIPYSGTQIRGKNGFFVKFRWKLRDGYLWGKDFIINHPKNMILKNPKAASVPKIIVEIRNIARPKGEGGVRVNSFIEPNGAHLQYKIDEETIWNNVPVDGKSWKGKQGFKIHFRWTLSRKFVWDENQPQKIINPLVELKDPIDSQPPEWIFKKDSSNDFKIIKKSPEKYEVNLNYYYGERILIDDILNLFEAKDRYGKYISNLENNIFHPKKGIEIIQDNKNAIILSALDLADNKSELTINILIKYRIEDLSNAIAYKAYFKETFSNFGEIAINSKKTPRLIFREYKTNNVFNIVDKNIHAIYRVVNKNGNAIRWFNNQEKEILGWSSPDKKSLNSFGQNYPNKLSNNQIIQIKFLPKNGYRIQDYISKQEVLQRKNKPQFVASSRIFEFKVENLIEILDPSNQEPAFLFLGNDGQGRVRLRTEKESNVFKNKTKYLLQVFRPYFPKNLNKNKEVVDKQGNPIYGFEIYIPIKNGNMNDHSSWYLISGVSEDFSDDDLDIEEIRKLWKNTRLSLKVNDVPSMINTLISPEKITKLSNFYFLRTIEMAKKGWGYRYTGSNKIHLYPKQFIKKIVWKKKDGNLYFGIKVKKLSINPIINILDKTFSIEIKPSIGNSYSYEGDMRIILSYYPNRKNGDKFVWRYKILDKNNNIASDWSSVLDTKNIKNGYKLIVGYQALPSFALSSQFITMQRTFIVNELKNKIDISFVPRPKIVFSGNVNYGAIVNLVEYELGTKQLYERNKGFPSPKTQHPKSLKLKWQYRVFNINPTELIKKSSKALHKFAWNDDLPKKLNNNQYIQIRVAPVNNKKYGVEPQVYSINPKTKSPFVRVNGLKINWKFMHSISFEIMGDKNQNILKILSNNKQKDFQANLDALIFEVKVKGNKIWNSISYLNNNLQNGMILSFRSYAKDPYLSHLPNSDLNNEVKLIDGKKYLQFSSWKKIAIKGLKNTIYFEHISIKKPKLVAMENTPWERIKKSLKKSVILNGWAKIEKHVANLQNLKSAYYEDENGFNKSAIEQVEVQYQLLEYDLIENKLISQGWSTIPPTNLKNNDQIQIKIAPKNPDKFQLDLKRELIFKVENLYEDNKVIQMKAPTMVFSGINGQGIGMPAKSSPDIYIYSYQIYDTHFKLIRNWSKNFPTNLKNRYYVKSRITKTKDNETNPKFIFNDSGLQKVYGLFVEFSLHDVNMELFLKTKVIGRINYKASLYIDNQIVKKLKIKNYKIEYIVFNKENKKGKRFLDVPNNLSNGDRVEIEIVNKKTGTSQNLKVIENKFKTIHVKNLVDDEPHTKTMSKSIWIPAIILTSLLLVVSPIYLIRRKRKLSV